MQITLDLTEEEAEMLEEVLSSYQDCGPLGEGWQSAALENVSFIVSESIKEASAL